MNELTRILMATAKSLNAENGISLKKVDEFGDEHKGAGVYHDKEWGEYRVVHIYISEHVKAADYHTSDKLCALDTARKYAMPPEAVCADTSMSGEGTHPPLKEEPVAVKEEADASQIAKRPRPRGYYTQPSKLLSGLLRKAL